MIVRVKPTDSTTYANLRDAINADGGPNYALSPANAAQLRASGMVKFNRKNEELYLVSSDVDEEDR